MQGLTELPNGIDALLTRSEGRNVSIYMPSIRAGPDVRQNRTRFKNLVRDAARSLGSGGDTRELLEPAETLLDDAPFWRHPGDGLCMLVAPDLAWRSWLPRPCEEAVVVADTFHVTPLVPLVADRTDYDVLALSRDEIRLHRGNRFGLEPVETDALSPENLDPGERDFEKQLQFYTGTPSRGGARDAVFYGTGGTDADPDDDTIRRFRRADVALWRVLRRNPQPLVLCGVDRLPSYYRRMSSHPRIVAEVNANPFEFDSDELHRRTWRAVAPLFEAERVTALRRHRKLSGQRDPRAASRLEEILASAAKGRVAVLLAAGIGATPRAGDENLRAVAVVETLRNDGLVYVVDAEQLPSDDGVAAILRF